MISGQIVNMEKETFILNGKDITGYVIPIGPVNLVFAQTEKGIVGCGAIDAIALEKFSIPVVKVKPVTSDSIRNIEDLQNGIVSVVNSFAKEAGIQPDITGKEALIKLL